MYICYQTSENSCGQAVLRMFLANVLKSRKFLELNLDEKKKLSFYEIINICKNYGIELEGYQYFDKEKLFLKKNSIVLLNINGKNHYVYYVKKTDDYVEFIDPTCGLCYLKNEDFINIFTGYCLLIKNITRKPRLVLNCNKKFQVNTFIFGILSFIEALTCGFLFYFFSKNTNFYLLYVLLIAFMLLEIIKHSTIVILMKKYDSKLFINIDDLSQYSLITNIKKEYFNSIISFYNGIFTLILTLIILAINLPIGIVFLFGVLLIYLFFKKAFKKKLSTIKTNILYTENSFKDNGFKTALKNSYRFEEINFIISILPFFILSILYLFFMNYQKIDGLNYFLFYFFSTAITLIEVEKIINCRKIFILKNQLTNIISLR